MATIAAGENGTASHMSDHKSIDKGKQPVRPPEKEDEIPSESDDDDERDPGLLDTTSTPSGKNENSKPSNYSSNFGDTTHPGIRNLDNNDSRELHYNPDEEASSDEEEEEEGDHRPRIDTSFVRPRHSSASNSYSDHDIHRSGIKEPMSAIEEEDSSEEDDAGAVQTAQVGRVHSMKHKGGTPIITNKKFAGSRSGSNASSSNGGGPSVSPSSERSDATKDETIILAPRGVREVRGDDVEHFQVKIVPKDQQAHPKEEYRLHLTDKNVDQSHEKFEIKLGDRKSSPDLPEVVPSTYDEKEAFVPTDDKIPRPRHDEKIPIQRHDDKILSPNPSSSRAAGRNDSQFSSNNTDEKLLPLYAGFEDNLKGGDYFVGTAEDLSRANVTDGRPPLKIAADGSILIPQPSDDPNDPLNWSWMKKHSTFWALLLTSLLSDLVISYGTILFNNQAYEWSRSANEVSRSAAGAILMQAPGGLFAVPIAQRFGRLPVLFWSQFFTLIATLAATYTHTYPGFTAMRAIQGFFAAAPQVIGLSMIYDMFFFHERARKINTWLCLTFLGPYLGVFMSTLIVEKLEWRDTFAILCGLYGFSVVVVAFLAEETLFNARNPWPGSGGAVERIMHLTGFVGALQRKGRPTVWQSWKHVMRVLVRPYVIVPICVFTTIMAMWNVGLINTIPRLMKPLPYQFTLQNTAFLCFAPMVGIIVAEIWGRGFNDFLAAHYIKHHRGHFKPEIRLWAVYPSWALGILGLVLVGQALTHQMQWGVVAIAWAFIAFSALGTTVAITAYLLDVLPFHAAATAAWLVFFRSLGGFAAPYIENKWIRYVGTAQMFGIQGAAFAGLVVFIMFTQILGPKWRAKFPAPKPKRQDF